MKKFGRRFGAASALILAGCGCGLSYDGASDPTEDDPLVFADVLGDPVPFATA